MAATKAYNISNSWVLVGQNITEFFIVANKQYDLDLFIGPSAPSATTRDFITIDGYENFGATSLSSGNDVVYLRCGAGVTVEAKVLTL